MCAESSSDNNDGIQLRFMSCPVTAVVTKYFFANSVGLEGSIRRVTIRDRTQCIEHLQEHVLHIGGYLMISELGRAHVSARGGRRRCDDCPAVDIRHPRLRELIDQPGASISWRWNRNGTSFCLIDITFHADHVLLTDVMDRLALRTICISLLRTPCHYGGTRIWLECPSCRQRCARLYFCNASFQCRKCQALGYMSQLEASSERARLIAQRIRRRLGGSPNLTLPFPAKPPRMHWRTYYRIREKGEHYEFRAWERLAKTSAGYFRAASKYS